LIKNARPIVIRLESRKECERPKSVPLTGENWLDLEIGAGSGKPVSKSFKNKEDV
jgi:hypothetical protein